MRQEEPVRGNKKVRGEIPDLEHLPRARRTWRERSWCYDEVKIGGCPKI